MKINKRKRNDLVDGNVMEDFSYIENSLPEFLKESIRIFKAGYKNQFGEEYYPFDLDVEQLSSDINVAEVEDMITHKQADFLRSKYLQREFEWD